MTTPRIAIPHDQLAAFCEMHRIRRLALFGSVLRDDFGSDSDIDILVDFEPDYVPKLYDIARMEHELAAILGRRVEIGERQSVLEDPNYIRRRHILDTLQTIYET